MAAARECGGHAFQSTPTQPRPTNGSNRSMGTHGSLWLKELDGGASPASNFSGEVRLGPGSSSCAYPRRSSSAAAAASCCSCYCPAPARVLHAARIRAAPAPRRASLLLCSCSSAAAAPALLTRRCTASCSRHHLAPCSRLTRAVARAREHRAAAAGPAHARPCAPHPCTVPLVPLRAPAPPSPRASTARAPPQASTAGLASSRGAREEGGFQRRVRGEERREEKRQRGEGRADKWAPPPCGVHVTKTTTKTTPMAKYDRF